MKAIHGGKAKNDKIDSYKIAKILRGGTFPTAYVYPRDMRSTRDLLRRRMHLMRKRAELLAHIHNTNTQCNLPQIAQYLSKALARISCTRQLLSLLTGEFDLILNESFSCITWLEKF